TLLFSGPRNSVPTTPDLSKKFEIELAAQYRLTDASFQGLDKDRVPADVLAALRPLKDRTFPSTSEFEAAVKPLLPENQWSEQGPEALMWARVVKDYVLTAHSFEVLRAAEVPEPVVASLEKKFNDVTFRTLPEFRARLADLLSPGDLAKY